MNLNHVIEMRLSFPPGEDGYRKLAEISNYVSRRKRFYYLYQLGLQAERSGMLSAAYRPTDEKTENIADPEGKTILMRLTFCGHAEGYGEIAALSTSAARRRRAYYLYNLGLQIENGRMSSAALPGTASAASSASALQPSSTAMHSETNNPTTPDAGTIEAFPVPAPKSRPRPKVNLVI